MTKITLAQDLPGELGQVERLWRNDLRRYNEQSSLRLFKEFIVVLYNVFKQYLHVHIHACIYIYIHTELKLAYIHTYSVKSK